MVAAFVLIFVVDNIVADVMDIIRTHSHVTYEQEGNSIENFCQLSGTLILGKKRITTWEKLCGMAEDFSVFGVKLSRDFRRKVPKSWESCR